MIFFIFFASSLLPVRPPPQSPASRSFFVVQVTCRLTPAIRLQHLPVARQVCCVFFSFFFSLLRLTLFYFQKWTQRLPNASPWVPHQEPQRWKRKCNLNSAATTTQVCFRLLSFFILYFFCFVLIFLDFDSWEINHSVRPSHQRRRSSQQHTRSFNCFLFMLLFWFVFRSGRSIYYSTEDLQWWRRFDRLFDWFFVYCTLHFLSLICISFQNFRNRHPQSMPVHQFDPPLPHLKQATNKVCVECFGAFALCFLKWLE